MFPPIDGWDVRLIDFGLAKMVGMKQEDNFFGGMVSMKAGLRLENVEEVGKTEQVDAVDGDGPSTKGGNGDGDVTKAGDDAVPLYEMTAGGGWFVHSFTHETRIH